MTMKHKHHIVPKHAGGTDDPDNLIELTISEHAQAHYDLWLEHGDEFDYLAYLGLSGQIGQEEILQKLLKAAGKRSRDMKAGIHGGTPEERSEWGRQGALASWAKNREKLVEAATAIFKVVANTRKPCPTCGGLFNPGVMKLHNCAAQTDMYITDGEESKRWPKDKPLPEGWVKGHKMWAVNTSCPRGCGKSFNSGNLVQHLQGHACTALKHFYIYNGEKVYLRGKPDGYKKKLWSDNQPIPDGWERRPIGICKNGERREIEYIEDKPDDWGWSTLSIEEKTPCPNGCGKSFHTSNLRQHLRGNKCPMKNAKVRKDEFMSIFGEA